MSGILRVDNMSPADEERMDEYLSETRSIMGFAHVFEVTMTSGYLPLQELAEHEARLDGGSGPTGRFQSVPADVLNAFTRRLMGSGYRSRSQGGDHRYDYIQPFAFPPFEANAIDVQSIKELKWLIDWRTNASEWSNVSADTDEHRMYALVADDLPEVYIPRIDRSDIDLSGAGDQEDVTFQDNVAYIVLRDKSGGGVIGDVRVVRDGENVYGDIPADNDDLTRVRDHFHSVDDPDRGDLESQIEILDVMQGNDPVSALAQNVTVEIDGAGSGDVDVFAFSVDYENSRSQRSLSRALSRLDERDNRNGNPIDLPNRGAPGER